MARRTTVQVAVKDRMVEVEGYNTDVEGLVAHRVVRINYDDEIIYENEWVLTHRGTGMGCLPKSWLPTTKRDAYRIADKIGPIEDWTRTDIVLSNDQKEFIRSVSVDVAGGVQDLDRWKWVPPEEKPRYIIRPVDGVFALVKIIGKEEEIIDNYRHRGEAGVARRELANG